MDSLDNWLNDAIQRAEQAISTSQIVLPHKDIIPHIEVILNYYEGAKAVFTVLLTSLVYKLHHPEQDIRKHQASINGGYSGRSFDAQYITPFLKRHRFPAMAESGWLTRSLEQKIPYDRSYTGAIRPLALKDAFITSLEYIEYSTAKNREQLLHYILCRLVQEREKNQLTLATPQNLSINQLLLLLEKHFLYKYNFEGASRLPTLALYSIYQILIQEMNRFEGCTLLPLESHTSADRRSGRLGDIDIIDSDGRPFESVEIKHLVPINLKMIETAHEKFMGTSIKRYYILSTASITAEESTSLEQRINEIKNTHGCQLIANGIYTTLKYYLRLIQEPAQFVLNYTTLLSKDNTIKYEHKKVWNSLVLNTIK